MTEKEIPRWDPEEMVKPTEFMDYEQLMERIKKDLNITNKKFWIYDLPVPHNETEYQEDLKAARMMQELISKTKDSRKD